MEDPLKEFVLGYFEKEQELLFKNAGSVERRQKATTCLYRARDGNRFVTGE